MPLVHGVEGGGGVPIEGLEVVQQFLAVGLHRHDVVGPLADNQTGRFRAAVQGVERQCAAGDVQLGDEPPRPEDLPAGAVRCSLPHHDAAAVLHRGQEHTGIVRPARTVERGGLPVEGQGPFRGLAGRSEAAHGRIECVGVQCRQEAMDARSGRWREAPRGRTAEGPDRGQLARAQPVCELRYGGGTLRPGQLGRHGDGQHTRQRVPDAPRRAELRHAA